MVCYVFQIRENYFYIMIRLQLFKSVITVFSIILNIFAGTAVLAKEKTARRRKTGCVFMETSQNKALEKDGKGRELARRPDEQHSKKKPSTFQHVEGEIRGNYAQKRCD